MLVCLMSLVIILLKFFLLAEFVERYTLIVHLCSGLVCTNTVSSLGSCLHCGGIVAMEVKEFVRNQGCIVLCHPLVELL